MKKTLGSKMKIEIPLGKGRPTKPDQSAKLSNELGIIARNFLFLPNKWKELTREDKDAALIRCHERFEINLDEHYVKDSCQDILKNRSRQWRYKLKQLFESAHSEEEARKIEKRCDINKVNRTKLKSNHFMGSKAFVAARAEMGYVKGLGYGPKLNTTRATQRRTVELEDSLKKAKQEAASVQHDLQKRLNAAETEVENQQSQILDQQSQIQDQQSQIKALNSQLDTVVARQEDMFRKIQLFAHSSPSSAPSEG
ncbi:uncharacterized protein LOC125873819 [Solanum stenotomum]|uniref:uncharacterized protein LOC125873819 n=1 Tax=Solanum stenotomum TaxID=172797 RepID=UPI0020D1B053|nr:uncharacterized protein LOC125873819 [Solanum stenotomum]